LADPALTMNDRLLSRDEVQLDRGVRGFRREVEGTVAIYPQGPRIDPGEAIILVETSLAKTAAAHFLVKQKLFPGGIGHREMGEFQIINHEARSRRAAFRGRPDSLAKKSQLITEAAR